MAQNAYTGARKAEKNKIADAQRKSVLAKRDFTLAPAGLNYSRTECWTVLQAQ